MDQKNHSDLNSHSAKISFLDEYRKLLKDFDIDYDEKYIFKELESHFIFPLAFVLILQAIPKTPTAHYRSTTPGRF
jgi:hypothetical protein